MLAVIYKKLDIVRLLVHHPRIKVNARDIEGRTPLMIASMNMNSEIFEVLLSDPRVDFTLKDNMGHTALEQIQDGHKDKKMFEDLIALLPQRGDKYQQAKERFASMAKGGRKNKTKNKTKRKRKNKTKRKTLTF